MEGLLCQWALALQEYDFHIEYKKGSSNSNADALSRRPTYQPSDVVSAVRTEVDIAALRYVQEHEPHLNQVLLGLKASHVRPPKWRQYPLRSYAHLWSQLVSSIDQHAYWSIMGNDCSGYFRSSNVYQWQ